MWRRRILPGEHQSDRVGFEDACPTVDTMVDVSEEESGQLIDSRAQRAIRVVRETVQAHRLVAASRRVTLNLAPQDSHSLVCLQFLVDLPLVNGNIRHGMTFGGDFR